jgi:hypothetical protein
MCKPPLAWQFEASCCLREFYNTRKSANVRKLGLVEWLYLEEIVFFA